MTNAIERLIDEMIRKESRIVVGLDPKWEHIPKNYYGMVSDASFFEGALKDYCEDYIRTVKDLAPAIKINSAFFEETHSEALYLEVAKFAKASGLFVIGDVKRADIGSTSEAYANAFLGEDSPFDAITINPYFGTDSIQPFVKMAVKNGKAVFVLVKTSNKSSAEIQDLELKDGKKVYEVVAKLVKEWGNYTPRNEYGYNCVGAVVGATHPEQAKELRKLMPNTFFLVPGYGAQGATAQDVAVNFDKNGLGAIVNSSRGIMCAYKNNYGEMEWKKATEEALRNATNEINDAIL